MENILSKDFNSNECDNGFIRCDIKVIEDSYQFVFKISEVPLAEYAIVFEIEGEEKYVADILNITKRNCIHNLSVDLNKIKDFQKIKIINIYSEKEMFFLDNFSMDTQNNEEENINIEEESEEAQNEESNNQNQESDITINDEEVIEENEVQIETDDNENINSGKKENVTSNEPNQNESQELNEDEENNIITFNNNLLERNFKKIDLKFFNSKLNYNFYIINLSDSACYDLNIIYNGFIMPVVYPFMGYSNDSLNNGKYPNMIFGKIRGGKNNFFVYGILGTEDKESQPFLGSTGFIYFEKLKNENLGYWIMFISENTGKISIPLRPRN